MGPTLPIMNIVAPSDAYGEKFSIIRVTEEEREESWNLWEAAHPGFGRSNWIDAFRDESGQLTESDEFVDAVFLFVPEN